MAAGPVSGVFGKYAGAYMLVIHRMTVSAQLVLIAGLVAGCGSKAPEPTSPSRPGGADAAQGATPEPGKPPGATPTTPRPTKPDISVTSKQYAEEYKKDRNAHAEKYKDKFVELTGVIKEVKVTPGSTPEGVVFLEGAAGDLLPGVQCTMSDKQPWKKALPGQTVKVRGKWPQFSLGAALMESEIVDVSGPKPATVTADQLAKAAGGGSGHPKEQIEALGPQSGYFVLAGEVAEVSVDKFGGTMVTLKVSMPKSVRVYCTFEQQDRKVAEGLKPGQKIEALGQWRYSPGESAGLHDTILLSPAP
jgi:hypothetical protein